MGSGTQLGRVRGLGAAKGGTHHWIVQRYTAVGNLLLVTWLVISCAMLPSFDRWAVVGWLANPLVAVPMILMIVSVFNHLRHGLQVLVEDYVHDEGLKFATLMLVNFYAIAAGTLGIFAVAKIAFTGGSL
jgi:succinate dehydrogenase / fumarate reductase membrane anchor subunit